MKSKSKKKEYKTLISALAYGSTDDSQKILEKYGKEPAKDYDELEIKLAKLYAEQPDKIAIEKQFAEIHPHSKFILKYLLPKEQPKEVVEDSTKIIEVKSNGCGCSKAEGDIDCPPTSNADGNNLPVGNKTFNLEPIALVSIVAIVGLVIIARKI